MIHRTPTLSLETKTYSYFDGSMQLHETTDPSDLQPQTVDVYIPNHENPHPAQRLNLYLSHNPWAENIIFRGSKVECVFRNCIVCGEKRFKDEYFCKGRFSVFAKPFDCGGLHCQKWIEYLGKGKNISARAFIWAIYEKNGDDLSRYVVNLRSFSYFDTGMGIQNTTSLLDLQPQQARFKYSGYYDHSEIDLYLSGNPWTTYDPNAMYNSADNKAGFIFRNCIVCGVRRFQDIDLSTAYLVQWYPDPHCCGNFDCRDKFHLLGEGTYADKKLYQAIFSRDANFLKKALTSSKL